MDDFLLDLLDLHPALVVSAIRTVAGRTGRFGVPQTALDIALYLRTHGAPAFAQGCWQNWKRRADEHGHKLAGWLSPCELRGQRT